VSVAPALIRRLGPGASGVPAAHLLAASVCAGLAVSLAVRATSPGLAFAAALLAVLGVARERYRVPFLAAALALAGAWAGSLRLEGLDRSVLEGEVGRAALARVEVTGPARRSEFASRIPVRVIRFGALEPNERARLDLPPERSPPQGALLEVVASVVRPRGPEEDGGFDEASYLRRQGIHVVLRGGAYRIVGKRGGLGGIADRLRAVVLRSLDGAPAGERRAVLAGIVLGEDQGLSAGLRQQFRASGLYHLLAVSGQNVAYVVAGMVLLAWVLGLPRWAGELGALVAVAAYVLAVGWQPSVIRAGVAGTLASLAWLASRPRDRWYLLLVGAAVLLAWNPYSLLDPGFQLSFAAVAAIFLLAPLVDRRLEGYPIPPRLATVVSVSAVCGVATAPILWLQFGAIPVYSIVANALCAPVVAPLLGLALASSALHPVLPSAAGALAWADGWLAAYLAGCARLVGGLPYAQATSLQALALLAGATLVIATVVWMRGPRMRRTLALGGLLLALLVAWRSAPQPEPPPPPPGLRLTVLDVGQGDSILLQVPDGAVLVDEGPPEAAVSEQLEGLGVDRLAALVLTHPQRDHVGGAADVLTNLRVGIVLDPGIPVPSPYEDAALAAARDRHVPVVRAHAGQRFSIGALRLRVLWPDGPGSPTDDPNNHAVVLVASYGEVDALLTADAESNVTLPVRPPAVEILKVGHHGSADEGLSDLLELVHPQVVVISVGRHNDYGHPAPSTMATLQAFSSLAVYRTDLDGRVTIETDGHEIAVSDER
jgi:competence protein ComEC